MECCAPCYRSANFGLLFHKLAKSPSMLSEWVTGLTLRDPGYLFHKGITHFWNSHTACHKYGLQPFNFLPSFPLRATTLCHRHRHHLRRSAFIPSCYCPSLHSLYSSAIVACLHCRYHFAVMPPATLPLCTFPLWGGYHYVDKVLLKGE